MTPIAIPPPHTNGSNGSGTPDVDAITDGNSARPFPDDHPLARLTPEQIDEIGREFQQIHDDVHADLGEADATYIRSLVEFHRRLVALSRVVLMASRYPPAWLLGTVGLSVAKIIENMELGHNILHGQWDWMNDPNIHSSQWDWDNVTPSASWQHSHNYLHHTYTNVLGLDRDVGYDTLRVVPEQRWKPVNLGQPVYNILLMALFQWGIAIYDLDFRSVQTGRKSKQQLRDDLKAIAVKAGRQVTKDYLIYPALSGRKGFRSTLKANATANLVRNVWSNAIIFCGHFPDQAYTYTKAQASDESRGAWYLRQLLGAVNIEGSDTFHLMSGNLSYQVEHHLFPDMPSSRYKQVAPQVKAICERYELPYNTGPFLQQWLMVQRSILRLAFPGGLQRRKAPPYIAPPVAEVVAPQVPSARGPIPAFP